MQHSSPGLQKAGDKLTLPPHPYSRTWAGLAGLAVGWLGWAGLVLHPSRGVATRGDTRGCGDGVISQNLECRKMKRMGLKNE